MSPARRWKQTLCATLLVCATARAQENSAPAPAAGPTPEQLGELHSLAESLWNAYAPESVKAEYELIPRDEFIALLSRVETVGQSDDLAAYAALAPETRAAIESLRALPDFADYADWLREQLEDMEVAGQTIAPAPPTPGPTPPTAPRPGPGTPAPTPPRTAPTVPHYSLWLGRIAARPAPERAAALLPALKKAFAAEGVPEPLVWLAEVESSFNPRARSPAGARGLFQLMPETAKSLGLSLLPFDQRSDPDRSAQAAASYLKKLHRRFGDWPLAIAAYNAGEGRVARELKKRDAKDFAGIADHLPAETRLYVPKVLATVKARSGVEPTALPAPR